MRTYKPRPPCHPQCIQGRHVFTIEESKLGYERAILAVTEKYPDARCQHGAALAHCLLRAKRPEWFAVRDLERRLARLEANHAKGVAGIKRELAQLKKKIQKRGQPKIYKVKGQQAKHEYIN